MTLAEAAIQKREVKQGIDPLAEKKRAGKAKIKTVNDLAADWLKNGIEKRVKHPEIQRRVYRKDLAPAFGELSLDRITPLDIRHAIRLNLMKFNPAEAFTVHQAGQSSCYHD